MRMEVNPVAPMNEKAKKESLLINNLVQEIERVIVGQKYVIERLLVGLLANGHMLIEGVPGLAKTMIVRVLSEAIRVKFQRIQFTPDLLPADLIGTLVYNPKESRPNSQVFLTCCFYKKFYGLSPFVYT
jgi:MoxR-like ATPase